MSSSIIDCINVEKNASKFMISEIPALRGYTVEWLEGDSALISRGDSLFLLNICSGVTEFLFRYPLDMRQKLRGVTHYTRRLFRHSFYNVVKFSDDSYFLGFGRQMGLLKEGHFQSVSLPRPTRILRSGCALANSGNLYFGEYISNKKRGPIGIYRINCKTSNIEQVYEFPQSEIRHVHGVYHDPYTNWIWVTTGDIGNECRICVTKNEFEDLEVVGCGSEMWRCVSLHFLPDCIVYGTDAEFITNKIYRLDRETGQTMELCSLDGTVFYGQKIGNDVLVGTTAELCKSNPDKTASIWHISEDLNCRQIMIHKKDYLSKKYFQYGHYQFPHIGSPGRENETFVSSWGLSGVDAHTFRVTPY